VNHRFAVYDVGDAYMILGVWCHVCKKYLGNAHTVRASDALMTEHKEESN
jgi:hypothetical protein